MTDNQQPDSGRIPTSRDILQYDAKTALLYEELRSAIDGGHESMTHADALAEISAILAENETLRAGYAAARLEVESLRKLRGRAAQPAPATQQAGECVYAFRRKGLADFCTCDEARYEELSNKPHLFETRIFYTAPQPAPAAQGDTTDAVEVPDQCPYFGPSPHRDVWLAGWYAADATRKQGANHDR